MATRLKVLMSAYSCEPGKGSEPEVGWQWALQMARFHDLTVVTRANNRPVIEPALAQLRPKQPVPTFVYHDRGAMLLEFKRRTKAVKLYYLLWQRSARELIHRLHQVHHFDLMHHVTFAGFRFPTAIWGHGAATIWGPIGGVESVPSGMLPWSHLMSLAYELARNVNNLLQSTPFHVLPARARSTSLVLASTPEMQQALARLGFEAEVMPAIGLKTTEMPRPPRRSPHGQLKLLFVGNIITLKGVDLALEALATSQTDATFTFYGTGNYLETAQQQVQKLGLQGRVFFRGRLPRAEVLKVYADHDVFVFPSLHDTGGYAVIEAMFNELPVICLDCGGPAVAVRAGCGLKVPVTRRKRVVTGLVAAIRWYDQNRSMIAEHGAAGRQAVLRHYDWDVKGEEMNARYAAAVERFQRRQPLNSGNAHYSGMGGLSNLLHRVFSMRGVAASLVVLSLIGALGFVSIGHLKTQADEIVNDTLPGLAFAGEANTSLEEAFNRTLLLVIAETPEQRAKLDQEIKSLSSTTIANLEGYRKQIFEPEDAQQFQACLQRRAEYVAVREQLLSLVEQDQRAQAVAVAETRLLPAFGRYKQAAERLFEYNIRQGTARGHRIMAVCSLTQFVVAGLGILVFVVGFFVGMFR